MQEFATVSASSSDPSSLAAQLTEKSAEGWGVVSIVSTAGEITAFLSRAAGSAPAAAAAAAAPVAAPSPEPSGWAVAPEPAAPAAAPMAPIVDPTPAASYQPTTQYQAQPVAQAPAQAQAIPPNWYADPSGRFEMRYWDGSAWTAHVSRGGQQFTDPPTA